MLGESLAAVYATGSIGFGDYDARRSDIDLMAVVERPLDGPEMDRLKLGLAHDALPCPAKGMDLILIARSEVESPSDPPTLEYSMATGHSWRLESERGAAYPELWLHFAICRAHGIGLLGPTPSDLIAPVAEPIVRRELARVLTWQMANLLDPYHDPEGTNSVLNGCRAWCLAETGVPCSKSQGGRWVLESKGDRALVRGALARKCGASVTEPTPAAAEIRAFLVEVLAHLA